MIQTLQTNNDGKNHEIFSDCIALLNVEGIWGVVQT